MANINAVYQMRHDTEANLANIVLYNGEPGYATDTKVLKIGDGVTKFSSLTTNIADWSNVSNKPDPMYICRAWVNFDGTSNGTFAGGASTVSRTAGSTTATITTTTAHGLITGNSVHALTGVDIDTYTVTVLTSTTFTITTVATTALTAAAITFAVNTIRASGNVSSVADNGNGSYTINFATAMPDANYAATAMGTSSNTQYGTPLTISQHWPYTPTAAAYRILLVTQEGSSRTNDRVNLAFFR